MQPTENIRTKHISVVMQDMFEFIRDNNPVYEDLREMFGQYPDDKFVTLVDALTAMNLIAFDKKTNKYSVETNKIIGEQIILDGETNLPVTIIEVPKENKKYISRGVWYELPLDFDIRRIKWNVVLFKDKDGEEVRLTDYLKSVALKEKKSKIKHNPEYDMLRNRIVPYSSKLKITLKSIGDEVTDAIMTFYQPTSEANVLFNGLTVATTISTKQLIKALESPKEERKWSEQLDINRVYSVNDFITKNNEIMISAEDGEIVYARITGIQKGFELSIFKQSKIGAQSKIDVETYYTYEELQARIRELLELEINQDFLNSCEIWIE